jgi:hypothetical protein
VNQSEKQVGCPGNLALNRCKPEGSIEELCLSMPVTENCQTVTKIDRANQRMLYPIGYCKCRSKTLDHSGPDFVIKNYRA